MSWSTLHQLTSAPVFWSLNVFFFAVPLIARMGVNVTLELFCLYAASIMLVVAAILIRICTPAICVFRDPKQFMSSGYLLKDLQTHYSSVRQFETVHPGAAVKTQLDYQSDTAPASPDVFTHVKQVADKTKGMRRWISTGLIGMAVLIIGVVNLGRLVTVINSVFFQAKEKGELIMHPELPHQSTGDSLSIGKPIEVETEPNAVSGNTQTTSGNLVHPDDQGFLVMDVTTDGKTERIFIPRGRILQMKQSPGNT